MSRPAGLLLAAATTLLSLAGCTSGGDAGSDAIAVENGGPEGGQGPYTFTARVDSADGNYTWDLGDHLAVLYGKTVTHTYDFKDSAPNSRGGPGNLTVTLRTRQAEDGGALKERIDTLPLRLGTGLNGKPTFVLDAQTNWAVVGETVAFSAGRSSDPDGDPLRYSWSCLRVGDAQRQSAHSHPTVGTPYETPPAGSVTSYLANDTLPAPTMAFTGDLCAALGRGTRASLAAQTIAGAFSEPGKYAVFLLGSDGPHPTVSGSFEFYVTPASERPAPWVRQSANVTLQLGGGGAVQGACDQAPPPAGPLVCDEYSMPFALELNGIEGWVNVTAEAGPGNVNNVTWDLKRGEGLVAQGVANQPHVLGPTSLAAGPYAVTAKLARGATAEVRIDVTVRLHLDPFSIY